MKFFYLLAAVCFVFSGSLKAQDNANSNVKTEVKPNASPSPSPTPPTVTTFNSPPDFKAYSAIYTERDPLKQIVLLEKFIKDFPDSFYVTSANGMILDAIIRSDPNNKDRIYQQALKVIGSISIKQSSLGSASDLSNFSKTTVYYNNVVSSLYRAKMDDKAEEIAQKGILAVDEANSKLIFNSKYQFWTKLGQIYFRKNDLKKSEKYFKQSITGDYEGNTALLGLADIAGKRKKEKQQFEYLLQADARGGMKAEQRATLVKLYIKQHGSDAGLAELLDENYRRANPFPFTVAKYSPTDKRSKRTVLAELFTGAECHPCITVDTAFEAFLQRYDPSDVAVLIYDLHIPGPDPITNPTTVERAKFYKASSTPTYFINGGNRQNGGGINRKESKFFYDRATPTIDSQLEKDSEADLKLSAAVENNSVKTVADYSNLKGDYKNLRLYIGLVENELSYTGGNGVRFHPMVVREIGGEARGGFPLKDKNGKIEWQFDLTKVSGDIKTYLDNYELERRKDDKDFAFSEKKYEIDAKNLSVVAFIQDETTKNILQSTFVNLSSEKK